MSTDYKMDITERAPTDKQDAVYCEATDGWADAMASRADYLNDRKGELQ